jgi:hypothetical protein
MWGEGGVLTQLEGIVVGERGRSMPALPPPPLFPLPLVKPVLLTPGGMTLYTPTLPFARH